MTELVQSQLLALAAAQDHCSTGRTDHPPPPPLRSKVDFKAFPPKANSSSPPPGRARGKTSRNLVHDASFIRVKFEEPNPRGSLSSRIGWRDHY